MRLSIAMIVRDEADMVAGFLSSVEGLWDELVVVDTGSTDQTVERFTAGGATVHHFAWCDDFAAARNESLRHVTGELVLVLDADERLSPALRAELLTLKHRTMVGAIWLRIANQLPYGHQRDSYVLRGWKMDPSIRFRFPIHEDASESVLACCRASGLETVQLEGAVEHLGYVRARAAAKQKKSRDVSLLHRCLEVDRFDFYARLKLLELARYWHDDLLWRTEAQACAEALSETQPRLLASQPWAGELIALTAEGLFPAAAPAALVFLDEWVRVVKPSAALFHRRGVCREHQCEVAKAREDFEACLALDGAVGDRQLTSVRPRLGLARVALLKGDAESALMLATQAAALAPRDPEALLAVATLTRALHGSAALMKVEASFRARSGPSPELQWAVGEALSSGGEHSLALRHFRAAAGIPPRGPAALRLAQALMATGQFASSETLARQLVDEHPEAGMGVLLFDLASGRDTELDLELTAEAANAAMKQWVDALVASQQRSFVRKVRARLGAVTGLFPWLGDYLLKKTA